MNKAICSFFILIFAALFMSCQTEITLTLRQDDSVDIRFEGESGEAFAKLINSAAGLGAEDSSVSTSDLLIDPQSVSYELAKAGFSDIIITQKKGGAVSISMCDKKKTSYIFSSKIIKAEKGKLITAITRKSLEDFYKASDEQTRMILDLFLAPVFNDEEMSEDEYLEMVGAFYGEGTATEVSQSFVKINLISKDGSKETLNLPLTQLFCGNFNY